MIFDGGIESAVDSFAFPVAERKNVGDGALDDPRGGLFATNHPPEIRLHFC